MILEIKDLGGNLKIGSLGVWKLFNIIWKDYTTHRESVGEKRTQD